MSRKTILQPYQIFTAADMSADATSEVVNIQYYDRVCIQLSFTGTPTGTFYVQTSLDYTPPIEDAEDNATWSNYSLSPTPAASGADGDILIDITQTSAPWIRVFYDRSSGSGTLNGYASGKSS